MTTPLDPSNLADRTGAEPLPAGVELARPDFTRPRKLSAADLAVLVGLQERFARGVGTRLARLLRCEVDVAFGPPEEITVLAHASALGETSVVAGIQIAPVPGLLLLEIAPEVALAVVERLLGGPGNAAPARGLTVLETGLVAGVVRQILPAFAEAIAPAEVEAGVAGIGAGPDALAGPSPVEPAVVLPFSLTLSTGNPPEVAASGPLVLFGLLSTVRPLLDQISPQAPAEPDPALPGIGERQPGSPATPSVGALLGDVVVALDVRLRPSRVPARDILGLRPGDVLRLDHGVDEPAIGSVRGVELLEGHVGGRARRLGIRFAGWRAGQ
jgi:flagellar motor switch protein FliM